MCCSWSGGKSSARGGGSLLPSIPPAPIFLSPPPESAVHLAPQIADDSRAISSQVFELNWSEQYHLCLLKGRAGEELGGGQKAATCNHQSLFSNMQSAQLAPL
ncbi:hypothetical protein CgunFtcFv8_018839 [Champsocephalus gunnari]|uniref:Uncharacterized protein n=1 Tax=Champsocephalus gunnari TaxID=52237 RepID=A0AAN8GUS8_CHAGU|nr:hypothetical protein CgunFtcFv8_018839 [Champsocephalus gunnari]